MRKKTIKNKDIIVRLCDKIENIIEHVLFKPIVVSIITSFVLFNGFSYLESYFVKKFDDHNFNHPIKINIPDDYNFGLDKSQFLHYEVKNGDTLIKILFDLGADEMTVFGILDSIKKIYDPKSIKVGDKFKIKYKVQSGIVKDSKDKSVKKPIYRTFVESIDFDLSSESSINIVGIKDFNDQYSYQAKKVDKVLTKHIIKYLVTVKNSLYVDGIDVGIPPNIMINVIQLYSFDVDFQRDIREGDKLKILFESYYDEKGNRIMDGNILYASLDLQRKKVMDMYLNRTSRVHEYFDAKGRSIKKSLLRTPINGARISSGFGLRRHPVLGYSKMHKGIDFAAPRGTPIFAAGDGVITYYKRKGGYGKFVQIRHNSKYYTRYAHASRFVKRLRVGSRVKQGDIIAYVGTTGRSTGPHLHYEIMYNNKQVNPASIKTVSGIGLKGEQLKKFIIARDQIDKYLKEIPNQNKLYF